MGTSSVSPPRHEAGEFVQGRADRIRLGTLLTVLGAVAVLAVAYVVLGGHGPILIGIGLLALGVALVVPRIRDPEADRWARGAKGERKVGAALEALGDDWHVLHDISLGRGNIDHILVGPGGTFTIETKSHSGRIPVDRIYDHMLTQAYAEAKLLEKISGLTVEPLLVFSDAYLVGTVPAHRRGVTILPARILPRFIARRRPQLTTAEATDIATRLRLALEADAR